MINIGRLRLLADYLRTAGDHLRPDARHGLGPRTPPWPGCSRTAAASASPTRLPRQTTSPERANPGALINVTLAGNHGPVSRGETGRRRATRAPTAPCARSRRKEQSTARAYLSGSDTDSGIERPFVINGLDALGATTATSSPR